MNDNSHKEKEDFLYPKSKYWGQFTLENLLFNANLQEFAQRLDYICALETNGKISSEEAYDRIKHLWEQLHKSKQELPDPEE